MFTRVSTVLFAVVALAGAATAAPSTLDVRQITNNQCNTGSLQCCTSLSSESTFISQIFGHYGLPPPPPGMIGFTCSPITVAGSATGGACVSQPVCCNGNSFNGISTGCSPVTIIQ